MDWIEIKITTTGEAVDAISEVLTEMGAGGVAIEDPYDLIRYKDDENNWDYIDEKLLQVDSTDVVIKAYFPAGGNFAELEENLRSKIDFISRFLDVGKATLEKTGVAEEDWSTAWKKYYKPIRIGQNIIIKPIWEPYQGKQNEIIIEMNPGMAFGTGTHETTRMCGIYLEKYLKANDRVLDLGCGTGILSIIAAKLGADRITAVDIDELAVKVTGENAECNQVDRLIRVSKGTLCDIPREKVDLIVANIIANVIIDISGKLQYYLKDSGLFIASGIIRDREQDVLEAFNKLQYTLIDRMTMGEWVAMVFRCPDSL